MDINFACGSSWCSDDTNAGAKLREIFKCHHQAPLWNHSSAIYCVPSGAYNSSRSAGLGYFQLGCPAVPRVTSPCHSESFPVEALDVEGEFSIRECGALEDGGQEPLPAKERELGRCVCKGRACQPPPAPSGSAGLCLSICGLRTPEPVQPVGRPKARAQRPRAPSCSCVLGGER